MRVVLLAVLLAGCASVGPTVDDVSEPASIDRIAAYATHAEGCQTTAVFFLVEEWQVIPYLPLGFRPQDLAQFYYNNPTTSSDIPVYMAVSKCDTFTMDGTAAGGVRENGTLELGYMGIYVEAPNLAGSFAEADVPHNFYALSFLAPGADRGDDPATVASRLAEPYGWEWTQANLSLEMTAHVERQPIMDENRTDGIAAPDAVEVLRSSGGATQGDEVVFSFESATFFPHAFEEKPTLRFWHVGPYGLGFMEFELPYKTVSAGPLSDCYVAPNSRLAELITADGGGGECNPLASSSLIDTFSLSFDDHVLDGRLRHLEDAWLV